MNTSLFRSAHQPRVPATNARNEAGGKAHAFDARHALAQYAVTGCLNDTFYASASQQLETVLSLCAEVPAQFLARTAVYARVRGFMKDLPALLVAALSVEDAALCERVFGRVIDDGKMLRNFVQVLRSGVVGRKSLGSMPRRLVRRWFERRDEDALLAASVGSSPSLADVIKLAHPRPATHQRAALYAWILGRECDEHQLPENVRALIAWRGGKGHALPDVPFQLLTSLDLHRADWVAIARRASWQQTRMNLNTFERHGVFEVKGMTDLIAARLRDRGQVLHSRVMPYQLLVAMREAGGPHAVRHALEKAMEHAIENVPALAGHKVYVCPDVSGSMHSPVTGARKGATTKVRCVDVAALIAAAVLRKNPGAEVLPFEEDVVDVRLRATDSVMKNAHKLASIGGGGTACSAPLARLNRDRARGDLVIFVSDNESWCDVASGQGTEMMQQWAAFKARNPAARLVCIDIQPNRTAQAPDRSDVLNVGGFSDSVFDVVSEFSAHGWKTNHLVDTIERVTI